jgi:hypothetical protein
MEWNSWLGGYRPQLSILSALCPQLNLLTPPKKKFLGMPLWTVVGYCWQKGKKDKVFNVHGSIHLGNICLIKGPTGCTYYVFFIPLHI